MAVKESASSQASTTMYMYCSWPWSDSVIAIHAMRQRKGAAKSNAHCYYYGGPRLFLSLPLKRATLTWMTWVQVTRGTLHVPPAAAFMFSLHEPVKWGQA